MSKHSEKISNARQLDLLCDQFEESWSSDSKPNFTEYLRRVDQRLHDQLLKMLLEVDVELRSKVNRNLTPELYRELGDQWVRYVAKLQDQLTRYPRQTKKSNPLAPGESDIRSDTAGSINSDTTVELQLDAQSQLLPGGEFGRYRIIARLGGGGMGSVYKAHDTVLERQVALKIPHLFFKSANERRELVERFHREAKAMATLNHPNLCQIFDVGSVDNVNFLTMALIDGQSLSERIQKTLMPVDSALHVCRKIALALHQAHQKNVIHRDLKPDNIMLTVDEEPIVIDFGLARRQIPQQDGLNTSLGKLVGTLAYMSPEQARGETETLTFATDIFSLGVVAFQLLTGSLPFQAKGVAVLSKILMDEPPVPSSIRGDISDAVDQFVQKLLAKDPHNRLGSMQAVADSLSSITETKAHRADVQRGLRKTVSQNRYDVFVSYSPADNTSWNDHPAWVTEFIQDLEWRICQLHGRTDEVSVVHSSDPIHDAEATEPRFLEAATLLIVNSPGYSNSVWPIPQLQPFRECVANKSVVGDVIVVEKDKPMNSRIIRELEMHQAIRFWDEPSPGTVHLLTRLNSGSGYFAKIDDVARRIVGRLHDSSSASPGKIKVTNDSHSRNRLRVYLAEVTDDLDPLREDVRRYLEQIGVEIHPTNWFSRDKLAFIESVNQQLEYCQLFVQLLGEVVGKKAPGSEEGYAQLQFESARQSGIPVIQWRGKDVGLDRIADDQHQSLVAGPFVQCSTIQEFKRELKWEIEKTVQLQKQSNDSQMMDSFVFLNVDATDTPAVAGICQLLDDLGVSYAMPMHEGRPTEVRKDLEENLIDCDALLIYYGQVSGQWVREQLRHWRKVLHKRSKPLKALAIYEGPPHEKSSIGMRLPNMEMLNCRNGLDQEKIQGFLRQLQS